MKGVTSSSVKNVAEKLLIALFHHIQPDILFASTLKMTGYLQR
ncbi:hypothetical protein CCP3SC5AM1_2270007 [Gammaproteobacteria bacterium]